MSFKRPDGWQAEVRRESIELRSPQGAKQYIPLTQLSRKQAGELLHSKGFRRVD